MKNFKAFTGLMVLVLTLIAQQTFANQSISQQLEEFGQQIRDLRDGVELLKAQGRHYSQMPIGTQLTMNKSLQMNFSDKKSLKHVFPAEAYGVFGRNPKATECTLFVDNVANQMVNSISIQETLTVVSGDSLGLSLNSTSGLNYWLFCTGSSSEHQSVDSVLQNLAAEQVSIRFP